MKRKFSLLIVSLYLSVALCAAQQQMTVKEYIDKYKGIAIQQMKLYKIPASIKLAQGLIESGNGNSRLARLANNHFGIKCKTEWTGGRIYHDDDATGECFRKYGSAEESYRDHSIFLRTGTRYASLFELKITDYKGWAHWLKAAGYATNPKYADMLIKTIEDNELYKYDDLKYEERHPSEDLQPKPTVTSRDYKTNNGVRYVVAGENDSMAAIAEREGITLNKILIFNDMSEPVKIAKGVAVYVQPKRNMSTTDRIHIVEQGETTHSISQKYAITLDALKDMNPKLKRKSPQVGQRLKLAR